MCKSHELCTSQANFVLIFIRSCKYIRNTVSLRMHTNAYKCETHKLYLKRTKPKFICFSFFFLCATFLFRIVIAFRSNEWNRNDANDNATLTIVKYEKKKTKQVKPLLLRNC